MIKWKKQSGTIIETNSTKASIAYAKKHGWKRVKPPLKNTQKVNQDDNSSANN